MRWVLFGLLCGCSAFNFEGSKCLPDGGCDAPGFGSSGLICRGGFCRAPGGEAGGTAGGATAGGATAGGATAGGATAGGATAGGATAGGATAGGATAGGATAGGATAGGATAGGATAGGGPATDGGCDREWSCWPIPSPSPPASSFEIDGGTVTDRVTGLVWAREPLADGGLVTWVDAIAECQGLGARLPTLIELQSIVDFERDAGARISATVFPNTPPAFFWTSSSGAINPPYAWGIGFATGGSTNDLKTAGKMARCVWSGPSLPGTAGAPPRRFIVDAGTVFDTVTMLTWQRSTATLDGGRVNWADATAYCADAGWRLPTVKELQSILDIRAFLPAVDPLVFPATPTDDHFWTSTPHTFLPGLIWSVSFDYGANGAYDPQQSIYSRCVR